MLKLQTKSGVAGSAVVACFIVLVALAKTSDRPWEGKPYTSWTQQDVERILTKSPWVHRIEISTGVNFALDPAASRATRDPNTGQTVDPATRKPVSPQSYPSGPGGTESITVSWTSSLTHRQALIRQLLLLNKITSKEAEETLASVPKYFEIFVSGSGLRTGLDPAAAKELGYLELEPSKRRIVPANVSATPEGGVEFLFQREVDGNPVIDEHEWRVHFHYKLASSRLT